jgi:hypothetical protein
MSEPAAEGFVPFLPGHRPRGVPRWWVARAPKGLGTTLRIDELAERAEPGDVAGVCGLAAPCSLPRAFLEHLGVAPGEHKAALEALSERTTSRLLSEARGFASRRRRGTKHPPRTPHESLSALDRRRLPLLCAALPLLRRTPTAPWCSLNPPFVFEVDVAVFLSALKLARRAGDGVDAVRTRVETLAALEQGAAGFPVEIRERELAVAAPGAFDAVVACVAAAWLWREHPAVPENAEAWIPLPT